MSSPVNNANLSPNTGSNYNYNIKKGWLWHTLEIIRPETPENKSEVIHSFALPWLRTNSVLINISDSSSKGIKKLLETKEEIVTLNKSDPLKNLVHYLFFNTFSSTTDQSFYISKNDWTQIKALKNQQAKY